MGGKSKEVLLAEACVQVAAAEQAAAAASGADAAAQLGPAAGSVPGPIILVNPHCVSHSLMLFASLGAAVKAAMISADSLAIRTACLTSARSCSQGKSWKSS
jgi:hypothetical protein